MEFKRWNSIENDYNERVFRKFMDLNPEINNTFMEVTEKIHGANFSIMSDNDGVITLAKRTSALSDDEKFYGFNEVFNREKYKELTNFLSNFSKEKDVSVQLYGELYGSNIQKGVFYGKEKNFLWYSLRIDGRIIPPKSAEEIMKDFLYLKVPVIGRMKVDGDLIEFIRGVNGRFQSILTPSEYEDENICEGVVITPYDRVFYNQSSLLLIKKKNIEFKDKSRKEKKVVERVLPDNINNLINEALLYINKNRTNDLFSKIGQLEEIKDISKYAKAYFVDVFEDFEKDNFTEWSNLEKVEKSLVKKHIGPAIFKELKDSFYAVGD